MAESLRASLRLVFVTPDDRPPVETQRLVERVVEGGVTAVIVRERRHPPGVRRALTRQLVELARAGGARALVSRDVDLALSAGADGVHTGFDGPSPAEVRAASRGLAVGRSAHWPLVPADAEADYLTLSPFAPTHRSHARPLLAPAQVEHVLERVRVPVVALGGLTADRVATLPRGLAGVAVIRALADAPDPRAAAARLAAAVAAWQDGGPDAADDATVHRPDRGTDAATDGSAGGATDEAR